MQNLAATEFELVGEEELEDEFEDFLGAGEFGEDEFETEWEADGEWAIEDGEEFFGKIGKGLLSIAKKVPWRSIAKTVAPMVGTAVGGPLGGMLGKAAGSLLEGEFEDEYEVNPLLKVYPAKVTAGAMEHLGRAAAEAEDAAHAEAFIGALVPLGMQLARAAAPALARATPQLVKGAANMTRALRADPATRPLVRAVPGIVRGAVQNIARQAAGGAQPSPPAAVRALATQAARTLTSPNRCVQAYRRSQALDRGYHQAIGR